MAGFENMSDLNVTLNATQERYLVAALYLGLSGIGLFLEALVFVVIIKQKQIYSSAFYKLLVGVMITEVVAFMLYAFYATPCVLTRSQVYGKTVGQTLGNLETVDFLALVFLTFVIALNRATSINGTERYHDMFSSRLCYVYIAGGWILGVVTVGIDLSLQCHTAFLEESYYFAEQCVAGEPALTATSLTIYANVAGMSILYAYSIWKMVRRYNEVGVGDQTMHDNMHKRKRLLLYQALCIAATLFINMISFRIIPAFLEGLPAILLTASIVLGTNYISPICMLIFNSDIRKGAKSIFAPTMCCRTVKPTSTINPTQKSTRNQGRSTRNHGRVAPAARRYVENIESTDTRRGAIPLNLCAVLPDDSSEIRLARIAA